MAKKKEKLPTPSPGRKLTKRQKIKLAGEVCKMYASGDYPLEACLRANGIGSFATWSKWRREIEAIEAKYQEAIEAANEKQKDEFVREARRGLLKSIQGHTVTVYEEIGEFKGKDQNGEPIFVTTAIRKKEVYVRPSFAAIRYALERFDPEFMPPEELRKTDQNIPLAEWTEAEIIEEFKRLNSGIDGD